MRLHIQQTCLLFTCAVTAAPPIIQPGAPGEASRQLTPEAATEIATTRFTHADVRFMQDMIPHHDEAEISPDPRANVAACVDDAESAIQNLTLVASLPRLAALNDETAVEQDTDTDELAGDDGDEDERRRLLSFANSDMAFAGDVLVVGSYHGFNIYRLNDGGAPELISSVVCPGGQGDVS